MIVSGGVFAVELGGRDKRSRTTSLHLPAQVTPIDMPLVICHPTKTIKLQGAPDSGRVTCDREVEGWRARPVGGALLKNLLTGPNMETSSPTRSHPSWPKAQMSFSLIDCVAVAVDQMRRNFELMRKQAKSWQRLELTDVAVKQWKGVRKS